VFKAGGGNWANGFMFVILGEADPHHQMSAIFDDNAADFAQVRGLIGGAQKCLGTVIAGFEGKIKSLEFLGGALLPGDVTGNLGSADQGSGFIANR